MLGAAARRGEGAVGRSGRGGAGDGEMEAFRIEMAEPRPRRRRGALRVFDAFRAHPAGLWILVPTEVWERFSYYGMRALLVLYMNNILFRPGEWQSVWGIGLITSLFGEPHDDMEPAARRQLVASVASSVYGLYTALVYCTPLPGGYLSDQYFGQRRMVILGGVIMAFGHFALAFHDAFLLGLALICLGNGCFKPNISTQVGRMYKDGDPMRTQAFFIFYCGINFGAFLSPIVCGELRQEVGYDAGFAAAGVGMLLGLVIYITGARLVPPDKPRFVPAPGLGGIDGGRSALHGGGAQGSGSFWEQLKRHRLRVSAIVTIALLTVPFWGVYELQGNTMALYGQERVNRQIGAWEMPTEFIQSINPFIIFALTPAVNAIWAWQRRRGSEPSPSSKMSAGLVLLASGYFLLSLVTSEEGGRKVSVLWIVLATFLWTAGELYLSPIGLDFISTYSPKEMTSLLMGVWFLSSFFGNYLSGWLGSYYPYMPHQAFFLIMAFVALGAGGVMFLLGNFAMRYLKRETPV